MNENLPFLLIGHRGCAGLEPENTLLGIRRAIAEGCSMIEVDVHLVEGELVVMHDFSVNRTTNGRGKLSEMDLASLRELDAGMGEKVPFLTEVLDVCHTQAKLNIEIKGEGCVRALEVLLSEHSNKEVIVSSFDWDQLRQFHACLPDVEIGVLVDQRSKIEAAYELADALGAKSFNPSVRLLSKELVQRAQNANMDVFAFTLRSQKDLEKVIESGADGAFVDDPVKVRGLLGIS